MKKTIIIAGFILLGFAQLSAQVSFRPGLRVGANFSHFTKGDRVYSNSYYDSYSRSNIEYNSLTNLYVGIYGALKLTKYYTLQPEIDYSNQGSSLKYPGFSNSEKFNVTYLSLVMINKFSFSDKFNIHLGPTLDFVVENDFRTNSDADLAFVLGAGYNFTKNIGIEARVKKGIIPVIEDNNVTHTNVVFSIGAAYTFDVK